MKLMIEFSGLLGLGPEKYTVGPFARVRVGLPVVGACVKRAGKSDRWSIVADIVISDGFPLFVVATGPAGDGKTFYRNGKTFYRDVSVFPCK